MKTLGIAAIFCTALSTGAFAQEGYTQLFDGKSIADWNRVGDANWRIEDGAVVSEKRAGDTTGYLLSKEKYKDFSLVVEVWISPDANSGIFMRCSDPKNV